jgi:dCMP deaminase
MEQIEKDEYYLKIAQRIGERSNCLSREIGAVLVRDDHIISTGFNGPASKVPHCEYRDNDGHYTDLVYGLKCPRQRMGYKSGEGLEHCPAVHAEINTILQAARFGYSTNNSTLYCWCPTPCPNCAKELINSGVKRIVCIEDREYYKNGLSTNNVDSSWSKIRYSKYGGIFK